MDVSISDRWPSIITCEKVVFDKTNVFSHVHQKVFQGWIAMFEEPCITEQGNGMETDEWDENYLRFLAGLKNRLFR